MKSLLDALHKRRDALIARLTTGSDSRTDELITSGQRLEDDGRPAEALQLYRQALEVSPRSARVHLNIGNAQKLLSDTAAALESFRRAIELDPDYAAAHLNLGNALMEEKQYLQAERCYRIATRLRPDWVEALVGLGGALEEGKNLDEAAAAYRRALAHDPGHIGGAFNLSELLKKKGDEAGARLVLQDQIQHKPGDLAIMQRLAELEWHAGRLSECVAIMRKMVECQPVYRVAHSILLYALNFVPDIAARDLFEEHRRFGTMIETLTEALPASSNIVRDIDRPLRVGYVSPDFRHHPVTNFLLPVLRCHDRSQFKIHCYYIHRDNDEITPVVKALADQWRAAESWDDDRLASAIQSDNIDILVDLAGHTGDNRLQIFARKPAPLQFTWLGYPETTGLTRMDYRICDANTDPVGEAESWQTEVPVRMSDSQWCYEPFGEMPPPALLPKLKRSYWTFGSFNNNRKLTNEALQAWSKILHAFPDSHLHVYRLLGKETQAWVLNAMSSHGIARERIKVVAPLPRPEYFASFGEIDVALDSFPYNGTTTTCETLLMGLPVLTVAGACSHSRVGISMMRTIGLPDWIADSTEDLPARALRLLADIPAIARLREELPQRMRASPLMDGPRFTRNLEAQYRQAWRRWCEGASPGWR